MYSDTQLIELYVIAKPTEFLCETSTMLCCFTTKYLHAQWHTFLHIHVHDMSVYCYINIASLFCGHPVMLPLIKTSSSSKDDTICGHGVTLALISWMAILTNPAGKSLPCSLFPAMMVAVPIGMLVSVSMWTLLPSFTDTVLNSVLSTEASVVNPDAYGCRWSWCTCPTVLWYEHVHKNARHDASLVVHLCIIK